MPASKASKSIIETSQGMNAKNTKMNGSGPKASTIKVSKSTPNVSQVNTKSTDSASSTPANINTKAYKSEQIEPPKAAKMVPLQTRTSAKGSKVSDIKRATKRALKWPMPASVVPLSVERELRRSDVFIRKGEFGKLSEDQIEDVKRLIDSLGGGVCVFLKL